MKLTVKNKKEFVSNFLGSVSYLNDTCVLKVESGVMRAIVASTDSTLILFADIPAEMDGVKTINAPDIKKLIRVLDSVSTNDDLPLELTVATNSLKFASEQYKFTYHLLEDGIVKVPPVNIKRMQEMKFDTAFTLGDAEIGCLLKGSSFATETNKLYIFCENNNIYGELGDKARHNSDNFQVLLSKTCTGLPLSKAFAVNFETFRLINFSKCKEVEVNINQTTGLFKISITKGDTKLIYIVSALIN